MSRRLCPAILLISLSVLPACNERMRGMRLARPGHQYYQHPIPRPAEGRQVALLFDRIPGQPTATAFNARSDWPSTSTRQQGREILYYTTYQDDRQGYGWFDHDYFYRSARYYQTGWQER